MSDFGINHLLDTIRDKNEDNILELIDKVQNPKYLDQHNVLHIVIQYGLRRVVIKLIEKGIDINKRCYMGNYPLIVACRYGQVEIIDKLLEHGADVNVQEEGFGYSPLMEAIDT